MPEFIIFHQPKTAGTYAHRVLPKGYTLGHHRNYHFCKNNGLISNEQKVCIVREPLDYYISLITFWCLDPKYAQIKESHAKPLDPNEGHINRYISEKHSLSGDLGLVKILGNMFDNKFLLQHANVLSRQHHTYDYHVFKELTRLKIGYYTFGFLDQFGSKKITDLKSNDEVCEELEWIKNNYHILHQKNISEELKALCVQHGVPFNGPKSVKKVEASEKPQKSNRKPVDCYEIPAALKMEIYEKDKFMYKIFGL